MRDKEKYIKLISKLNRLTKEKKITWEKGTPPFALKAGADDIWIDFYKTLYADTHLGIGEFRYQEYSDDFDKFYWTEGIVWAFLDDDDELEYKLPNVEGLWNILETIRRVSTNIDSKIDHLISAADEFADDANDIAEK